MKKILLPGLVVTLAICFGAKAAGDSLDVPPPREPLLPRMPANSEWTVKVLSSNDDSARLSLAEPKKGTESASPKRNTSFYLDSVTISKVNPTTYREISKWSEGDAREKWIVDRLPIQRMAPPINRLVRATSCTEENYSSYETSDFPDLEWIGKDNYVGPRVIEGKAVYVFSTENSKRRLNQREKLLVEEEFSPLSMGKRSIAYLDAKTQRPIFVDDGNTARFYSYAEAPIGSLTIPEDFTAMFGRWKKSLSQQ